MVKKSRFTKALDVLFILTVASSTLIVATHKTQIQDWWFFRNYRPSLVVSQLADQAGLSAEGRQLLYRGDPQLEDKNTFAKDCDAADIGCLTPAGKIVILKPANGNEQNQTTTTAAHEMLHLAYRRLSKSQRQTLDTLLEAEVSRHIGLDAELNGITDGSERVDEIHSLLGSEYAGLSPELETYYQAYFSDRSKALAAYAASSR